METTKPLHDRGNRVESNVSDTQMCGQHQSIKASKLPHESGTSVVKFSIKQLKTAHNTIVLQRDRLRCWTHLAAAEME